MRWAADIGRRAALRLPGAALAWGAAPSARAEARIGFDTLYDGIGVTGLAFSARARSLAGKRVAIAGYVAPPLRLESAFLVLTREPVAVCPFCQSDADWPLDIVAVLLRRAEPPPPGGTLAVARGRLELGSATDPESGFVSQARIVDAAISRA